ncbi:MAG: hypothetical protein EA380_04430 [Phycisphaeraceae bacterium]|nr:MAG: hypothetical protein EA380_04430 [Phycisphaeraceae bacterium]
MESTLVLASSGMRDMDVFIMVAQLVGLLLIFLMLVGVPSYVVLRSKRESEQTKREIAAYVAEGSITPEQGIEMLKAMGSDRKGITARLMDSYEAGSGCSKR